MTIIVGCLGEEHARRHTSHIVRNNYSVWVVILSYEKELEVDYACFVHDLIFMRALRTLHLFNKAREVAMAKIFALIDTNLENERQTEV